MTVRSHVDPVPYRSTPAAPVALVHLAPAQQRVDALDRRDDDLGVRVDGWPREALHAVDLGEEAVCVGRAVQLELGQRLPAKIVAIDEEEHAPQPGVLDEPVDV